VSVRHQDWVLKIDYENGAGDGHVIWRLGQGGDFTVNSTDLNPWFSHQHNAHYIDDSTIILFDNGNTRHASDPNAHSRGQVWKVDEQTMTATLLVNVDLGNYSDHFGGAQRLANGDYSFLSGAQGTAPKLFGQTIEVRPDGSKAYVLQVNMGEYRSFRIQTLYEGVSDQLAGDGGGSSATAGDHANMQDRSSVRAARTFSGRAASDEFWAAVATSLAAWPERLATANVSAPATPIPASALPLTLFGEPGAEWKSPDLLPNAASAASDVLFVDPGNNIWGEGLADDLARALLE